jgi:translation elongation factor EF-Tu-like GTPase
MSKKINSISLRDYFAAKAMQARIITLGEHKHTANTLDAALSEMAKCKAETAARAYEMADAMIAQREK